MKIIIVVLLGLMGLGMIALTPVANAYVSGIGFKEHNSIWNAASENAVATTNFARLMYVTGGLLILSGLVVSLHRRPKSAD